LAESSVAERNSRMSALKTVNMKTVETDLTTIAHVEEKINTVAAAVDVIEEDLLLPLGLVHQEDRIVVNTILTQIASMNVIVVVVNIDIVVVVVLTTSLIIAHTATEEEM
jgi:hypothetical protein